VTKPLLPNPRRKSEAQKWHRDVFAIYGGVAKICALCGKPGATDAAHVIPRAQLGKWRYADPRLGRPAHRECHERQERSEIDFSSAIRKEAVRVHNIFAKVPLPMPASSRKKVS
jgi:hypothetical protein